MTEMRPVDGIGRNRGRCAGGDPHPARGRLPGVSASRTVEARRELLEQLQVVDIHLQTAGALEIRADRSTNSTFAAVLRHRAAEHRRTAEKLRENLVLRGLVASRLPRHHP